MTISGNPHPLLAYENPEFVESEDARPLRILAEYLEPLGTFRREHVHETIVFFGSARLQPESYWKEILDFEALVRHGMISRDDLRLLQYADDPATALGLLQATLTVEPEERSPALASSRTPRG